MTGDATVANRAPVADYAAALTDRGACASPIRFHDVRAVLEADQVRRLAHAYACVNRGWFFHDPSQRAKGVRNNDVLTDRRGNR